MGVNSRFSRAKTFLTEYKRFQICTCGREADILDYRMSEQDLAIKKCPKCSSAGFHGWLSYYDGISYGAGKSQSPRKTRMYKRFMTNARFLKNASCKKNCCNEGLWSFQDSWASVPYSIFADPKVFASGTIACRECIEDFASNRPGNYKGKGINEEEPVQLTEEEIIAQELAILKAKKIRLKDLHKKGSGIYEKEFEEKLERQEVRRGDPYVTHLVCEECKESLPVIEFVVSKKNYNSDRNDDYRSSCCHECRKKRMREYSKTGGKDADELARLKKLHDKYLETEICSLCANKNEGKMGYYHYEKRTPVKFFYSPWDDYGKYIPAHKECIALGKRKVKYQKLLNFEKVRFGTADGKRPKWNFKEVKVEEPKVRVPIDFNVGDVMEMDGSLYYVLDIFEFDGRVKPMNDDVILIDFYWKSKTDKAKFVRRFTQEERANILRRYEMKTTGWKDVDAKEYLSALQKANEPPKEEFLW